MTEIKVKKLLQDYKDIARRIGLLEDIGHRTVLLMLIDYITQLLAITRRSEYTLTDTVADAIGSLIEYYRTIINQADDYKDHSTIITPPQSGVSALFIDKLTDLFIFLLMYIGTNEQMSNAFLKELEIKYSSDITRISINPAYTNKSDIFKKIVKQLI